MKCKIDGNGVLHIETKNDIETYAVKSWVNENLNDDNENTSVFQKPKKDKAKEAKK